MKRTKLSQAIIVARMTLGLPQMKFGNLMKVSAAAIGQWERGETVPSAKQMPKLAEVLKLDIAGLIKLMEEK